MTGPARITIELEPPTTRRARWIARTRVEEPSPADSQPAWLGDAARPADAAWPTEQPESVVPIDQASSHELAPVEPPRAPEQREPAVTPVGYEPPADCTCFDGFCEADHANE